MNIAFYQKASLVKNIAFYHRNLVYTNARKKTLTWVIFLACVLLNLNFLLIKFLNFTKMLKNQSNKKHTLTGSDLRFWRFETFLQNSKNSGDMCQYLEVYFYVKNSKIFEGQDQCFIQLCPNFLKRMCKYQIRVICKSN